MYWDHDEPINKATGQINVTGHQAGQFFGQGGEAGGRFLDSRGAMGKGLGYYQDMIEGKGPSVAEQQMRAGLDRSIGAQTAMAANSRGNQTAAMRQAGSAGAAMAMQGNQQAAQLRAQEQQAAMQGYGQMAGQMAGLDLQQQMGLSGLGADMQLGAMGAMTDYELGQQQMENDERQRRWDRGWGVFDRTIGMVGGAMGGAMMSDERCKRAIEEMDDDELAAMLSVATGEQTTSDAEALALAESAVSGDWRSRPDAPRGYAGAQDVPNRHPNPIAGPPERRPPPPAPSPVEGYIGAMEAGNDARFSGSSARYTGRGGAGGPTAADLAVRDADAALRAYPEGTNLSQRERDLRDSYVMREYLDQGERDAEATTGPVQMTEAQLSAQLRAREEAAAQALGGARGATFEYKPGAGPPGRRPGVMAQDMPPGVAVQTPAGLGIDRDRGLGLALAAGADQERRIRELEQALAQQTGQGNAHRAGRGFGLGLARLGG